MLLEVERQGGDPTMGGRLPGAVGKLLAANCCAVTSAHLLLFLCVLRSRILLMTTVMLSAYVCFFFYLFA